jgi:RHS repeat-associated protein
VQPAPDWAQRIYSGTASSPTTPVTQRESLTALADFLETIAANGTATTTLYEIPDLYLTAAEGSKAKVLSGFKAAPFVEPATGLAYLRARWYDTATVTFLTPDPLGYRDSSNLYAFAGGDPVNRRDPTGKAASMSESGWIIATDNRQNGRLIKFSPQQIRKYPVGIRRFLGSNADVDPREADAMMARAGQIAALGNVAGIAAVARGTQIAEPVVNTTGKGLLMMSTLTGVGAAAQVTQALTTDGATKTNVTMAGLTLLRLGWADDVVRLSKTSAATITTAPGLLTRARRVFWDSRDFRTISREYWAARGGANGRSLHHWLMPQRRQWVPQGLRNAGFNLVDLPAARGVFHRSLGMNQWMGFARNWGPQHATQAAMVENTIRVGVPLSVATSGGIGYAIGTEVNAWITEEESKE